MKMIRNATLEVDFGEVHLQLGRDMPPRQSSIPGRDRQPRRSPIKSKKDSSSQTEDNTVSLENLSEDLEGLLDDGILPDVQLMAGSTSIPCHRTVLAARSKVFAAMFQHEMIESTNGVLKIQNIDADTIKLFIKYLYSGKIPGSLTEDMLVNLFKTAGKYEVNDLKRVCSRKLMKNINGNNCLFYLTLADAYSYKDFKDQVAWYIAKDDSLIDSEEWKKFWDDNSRLGNEVLLKHMKMKRRGENENDWVVYIIVGFIIIYCIGKGIVSQC